MKGIILAGGSGSRLYPLTQVISKQLLPVYDKPMIYYPLSTLLQFDITDILIISTPQDTPNIERLFGDGSQFGLSIQYKVQPEPNGIAQAFIYGAEFVGCDDVCLILGDNIFGIQGELPRFKQQVADNKGKATIFAYHVNDPERFGVVEFDKDYKVLSIEEKPKQPKSNYASVGLYFYPGDVVEKTKLLKPSARGELEITDLNNLYLKEGRMNVVTMRRGNVWLDAGTPTSLMEASQYIGLIEQRQGLKIACIEEIVYKKGFIDDVQMQALINKMKSGSTYRAYLEKVLGEAHENY
ncbi:MAG: glucose-1-phosphate thymidylyltransferase RfbA [Oxalobacter sp.]|nr:glucose-1-phosphate thymidylyltransferase RfbA [Oxalobacter sp.]